jgi:hypothetical protein
MSSHAYHYIIFGTVIPYASARALRERDEATHEHLIEGRTDDLFLIEDGMNGKYAAIGKIIAKAGYGEDFDPPQVLATPYPDETIQIYDKIKSLFPEMENVNVDLIAVTHYN